MDTNNETIANILIKSVKDGSVEKVKALLTVGANINIYDCDGEPLLFDACKNLAMLDLFLSRSDTNVNIRHGEVNWTALIYSCISGLAEAVRRLVRFPGIYLNSQDSSGCTAAGNAVDMKDLACVKILSTVAGVDWNIKSEEGISPVMKAVLLGQYHILQILLNIPSIDVTGTDFIGRTIAQMAVEADGYGSLECLELLSRDSRVNWNTEDANGDSPLMYTFKNKKSDMFKILMSVPSVDKSLFNQDPLIISQVSLPQCPVCLETFPRIGQVHQCSSGHFVCGTCRPRCQNCPTCRGQIIGRCNYFEQFLQSLNVS